MFPWGAVKDDKRKGCARASGKTSDDNSYRDSKLWLPSSYYRFPRIERNSQKKRERIGVGTGKTYCRDSLFGDLELFLMGADCSPKRNYAEIKKKIFR